MAIDRDILVKTARSLLTAMDTAFKLPLTDFYPAVDVAVDEWHFRNRKSPNPRKTLATTGDITISAGVAPVRAAIEAVGIYPDKVKDAEIFITYGGDPELSVRFVNSRDRLRFKASHDQYTINAYFDGDKMYFQNVNDVALNAVTFQITADANVKDLALLPNEIFGEIAQILAEIMRKYNTDNAHLGVNKRLQTK